MKDILLEGLRPVSGSEPSVLVLGSFPGKESLERSEYYAHRRNSLWRCLGIEAEGHRERRAELDRLHVALWDVIRRCRRKGSLDSEIRDEEPNDLARWCRRRPGIRLVAFNGQKARRAFDTFVKRGDRKVRLPAGIELVDLPSTSPANARAGKVEVWRDVLGLD